MADMTAAQQEALREVELIASAGGNAVEILATREANGTLVIDVELDCSGIERVPTGIPVRMRERFAIWVPSGFPFTPPTVCASHTRWSGRAHVQWGRHLCLYQAPSTEWNPSDGMFGFLDRLWSFVARGAKDELDDWHAPLHPPVAYSTSKQVPMVVVRENTPNVNGPWWIGLAKLALRHVLRTDIVGWAELTEAGDGPHAAAFLLPSPMPYEYPSTVSQVTAILESAGIPQNLWILVLACAARHVPDEQPLLVVIGTPMRGVRGGRRIQHLATWHIEPVMAWALRKSLYKHCEDTEFKELGERLEQIVLDWASAATVEWCPTRELREETTIRRDSESSMRSLAGLRISLLGCGALGSAVAEHLVRAGVKSLALWDNGTVGPGLMVRQRYFDEDIGTSKVQALARHLRRISPELVLDVHNESLLSADLDAGLWPNVDLVVNTTASTAVATLLERQQLVQRPPIVSLLIGHLAHQGLVTCTPRGCPMGPLSVLREAKLAACWDPDGQTWLDEFWPDPPRAGVFQPEPGCSDATFQGSAAEVDALAAMMTLETARFVRTSVGGATFLANPVIVDGAQVTRHKLSSVKELKDEHASYRVLLSDTPRRQIRSIIAAQARLRGALDETGGLLFGQRDDAARVIWITRATPPPRDSHASADGFVCGVEGIAARAEQLKKQSRGSVLPIGMWHTHPTSPAVPSYTDRAGMAQVLLSRDWPQRRQLLLIVGKPRGREEWRVYLFDRDSVGYARRGYGLGGAP